VATPQRDKDHTEAQDEAERIQHDGAQQLAVGRLQGFHTGARDERDVAGTSGSTQGERNERTPAKNAAKGRGRLCIQG